MTAIQASLPLSHFYPETLGSKTLSQNLTSNELFTPLQLDRITVNPTRFEKYQSSIEKQPLLPWGRLRDYGGLQKVQLPEEFIKPRGYPPEVVQKGHRHYGTGASDVRDLKVPQYYDLTHLKKSHVRTSDQILPPSPSKDMNERRIDLPFPSEHPYYSHMSRFAVFPKFNTPDDPATGDPSRIKKPIPAETPATPYNVAILNKTKGSPYRHELQENLHESDKKALTWNGENDFYQLMKAVDNGKQPYFPTPPKVVHPNLRLRNEDQRLELRTVNALRNVEHDQWLTTYDYNYTGNGPSNAKHLDDYHRKLVDKIVTREDNKTHNLVPASSPILVSPRPLEGRYSRMYQQRRNISADIRYPDEKPKDDPLDVMDQRAYSSLPGTPSTARWRDEWYKTGRKSAEPIMESNKTTKSETRTAASFPLLLNNPDSDEQWKVMQLTTQAENGIETVENKKKQLLVNEVDLLSNDHSEKLPDVSKSYLKESQEERNANFKKIRNTNEMKSLECQYDHMQNMHALRNKVCQVGSTLKPSAFNQHSSQVSEDLARFHELRTSKNEPETRFDTGLKFSTEDIADCGTITDLHDRQLEGYKTYAKGWIRDIPTVDYPEQNHRVHIPTYVTKSNPFSLSVDARRSLPEFRTGRSNSVKGASTGSILKAPRSPPRIGPSRSISFNEIVKVATSEYGDEFKVSCTSLASDAATNKQRSLNFPPSPALRPCSAFTHRDGVPPQWRWNYDHRLEAEFKPFGWSPKVSLPRPQTSLLDIQDKWTRSDAHRRLHENLPEQAPDMRDHTRHYEYADKSADLRFHHSIKHKEQRHNFYGLNSHYFYN